MGANFPELLHGWHDFYALIGTAAATLVGLMFVAVSIAASFFPDVSKPGLRAFFTPTVVHFSAILIACVVVSAPTLTWLSLGILLLAGGGFGLGYSCSVFIMMGRRGLTTTIDMVDRVWYALSPIAGYLMVAVAAALLLLQHAAGLELLAVALVLLLMAGIRNAWDITVWSILRPRPNQPERP